jgi:hypothetical protein
MSKHRRLPKCARVAVSDLFCIVFHDRTLLTQFPKYTFKMSENAEQELFHSMLQCHLETAQKQENEEWDLLYRLVKRAPSTFQYMTEKYRNDNVIALEAVKGDGKLLEFASERIKNDTYIVQEAIKQNGYAIVRCNERFLIISIIGTKKKWASTILVTKRISTR